MTISIILSDNIKSTENRLFINLINEFKRYNIDVLINTCNDKCEYIIGNSIGNANKIYFWHNRYPKVKLICYNWDIYWWTQDQYNFNLYKILLENCVEIWCPSNSVISRTEQFFKQGYKCRIIKSYVEFFEVDDFANMPGNYVYHPLRKYQDPQYGWSERASKELGIPFVRSEHKLSLYEYQKMVSNCKFIVTEYFEASTGGLTLLEAYNLGKEVLFCDSEFMGASDYFGDRANYFKTGSYLDFKNKFKELWEAEGIVDLEQRKLFSKQFSKEEMAKNIANRLNDLRNYSKSVADYSRVKLTFKEFFYLKFKL